MKPHKHAELIKQWADGAEIEYKCHGVWFAEPNPEWMLDYEYRIKPEPKPTITKLKGKVVAVTMTDDEHRVHEVLWEAPKPLTDEEIYNCMNEILPTIMNNLTDEHLIEFARAIEKEHGIK